jgi:phospholipid:diacylglycerol acyltransferase
MFPYFLKWVENEQGGKGGSKWVDEHIESFVNIAGPMMGVPKAVTSLLSGKSFFFFFFFFLGFIIYQNSTFVLGETRDTMALGSFGAYVLEKFFSRRERTKLMRSWIGSASLLPKGGNLIWGQADSAPDDQDDEKYQSFGNFISFVPRPESMNENSTEKPSNAEHDYLSRNYTVTESIDLLLKKADTNFAHQLNNNFSLGVSTNINQLKANDNDPTKWSNPLEVRLPNAPNMKIYCFYGVGVPTERSYYYAVANGNTEEDCLDNVNNTGCMHENSYEHQTVLLENSVPIPKQRLGNLVKKKKKKTLFTRDKLTLLLVY